MQRGRPRKPRLSRMDAAVDAMGQFGFPQRLVRKCVKQLLKEYGGDEAWPFIEEYSYKELIEAILRYNEENDQGRVLEGGEQSKLIAESDVMPEENEAAPLESSNTVPETQTDDVLQQIEADRQVKTWNLPQSNGSSSSSPSANEQPIKRKRRPCCSWIVYDEEDDCPKNAVHQTVDHPKKIEADSQVKSLNTPPSHKMPSPSPILNNKPIEKKTVPCYGWIDDDEEACPSNTMREIADDPKKIEPDRRVKSLMISRSIYISSPLPIVNKKPIKRRRFPCYGWINNDDEDGPIEFVYSKPAPGWFSAKTIERGKEMTLSSPFRERKHKQSRWDLKSY